MRAGWLCLMGFCSGFAMAAPAPYTGPDLSGSYTCTGDDVHDGAYKGGAVFKLDHAQSSGQRASYTFTVTVDGGGGTYYGSAVAEGDHLAMTFANRDPSTRDYGTGLATLTHDAQGHWMISNFYYEPDYFGGNTGTEDCTQQAAK